MLLCKFFGLTDVIDAAVVTAEQQERPGRVVTGDRNYVLNLHTQQYLVIRSTAHFRNPVPEYPDP